MLVCIFKLDYVFERVSPSSFFWTFNQLWSCFDIYFFIFFRDLNQNFYLKQLIDFVAFYFLWKNFIFFFLFLSISSKFLSFILFYPTYFLLVHLWGIIFHAWWSTLVLWFLYLSSYIKNFIFCSIWSNLSICCFSSISFWFRSWAGSTY